MNASKRLADAQQPAVLPAALLRQLSQAPDRGRRTPLSHPLRPRRHRSQKHPGRAEPETGGAHYEEQMMRGKIFCGGQMEARCPHMEIGLRKFTGKRCLTNKGQARQGFNAFRAVSLYEGHGEKADAGFVDAQGSILTGRILVVFRAKLWYDKTKDEMEAALCLIESKRN